MSSRKRTEIIDDDGNELPPPDPGSPVAQIIYLLEYGRKRGFKIGPRVQVGDAIVEVTDIRQLASARKAFTGDGEEDKLDPESDMGLLLMPERQQ